MFYKQTFVVYFPQNNFKNESFFWFVHKCLILCVTCCVVRSLFIVKAKGVVGGMINLALELLMAIVICCDQWIAVINGTVMCKVHILPVRIHEKGIGGLILNQMTLCGNSSCLPVHCQNNTCIKFAPCTLLDKMWLFAHIWLDFLL